MAFQLTISERKLRDADALKRKRLITVESDSATLGPADATCPLVGFSGESLPTIEELPGGNYQLRNVQQTVLVNDVPCQEPQPLHSGDMITLGDWDVQFHVSRQKVAQSWKSSILATSAQVAIAAVILAVLLAMFWLPSFLSNNDAWGKQAAVEELSIALDSARRTVKKIAEKEELDSFEELLLKHVSGELDSRVRYVRRYGQRLDTRQQKSLLEDVNLLMELLQHSLDDSTKRTLPEPRIEDAVHKIIADRLAEIKAIQDQQPKEKVKP